MSQRPISLTGIKPTGMPHLGNYLGAILPALRSTRDYRGVFFIADYHALTSVHEGQAMRDQIYQVAATWLALGLDPEQTLFYKQSDVPEIFELSWILGCFTPKGFMNRAHGYKDKVAKNRAAGEEEDAGVNMGLYTYPVLMDADILLFKADIVPVGKDQKQHVEFARDVAQRFNQNYKTDLLTLPEPVIHEETDVIPGLDGRKMSKSYGNTIEIFLPPKELKKKVNRIVTNSQGVEEPKDPEACQVFKLYKLFATAEQQAVLAARYRAGGMGWGEAKGALFEVLEQTFGEARNRYDALLADRSQIDRILKQGAERARAQAGALMTEVRRLVGTGA
jgi:tryptophanyl-tRNA synthetase